MPLTGYLADVLGRKRFLLMCIFGFVVASALCGLSRSVPQIVFCRLLQGVFGAALVPLSQAIMADAYPPEQRGRAMAIWGLGVMVGPVIGPTFGGWLTEIASWRWTFFINVPVGAASLFLAMQFIKDTPRRKRPMDWTGFALITIGVAALQYVLDRGTQRDWLEANDIRVAIVLSILGLAAFVLYALHRGEHALFDIRIFKDRNFSICVFMMSAMGLGMYGGLILQPILLEGLLGYPIITTGLVMAPRGLATAVAMMIVGRLVPAIDARVVVSLGVAFSAVALIFVPLSTIAYATLDRSKTAEAAGIFSLIRTVGSAIGISVVTTVMSHQNQVLWNELGAHVTMYQGALANYLGRLHMSPTDPRGLAIVAQQVGIQARMGAILDAFQLILWSYVVLVPFILMLKKAKVAPPREPVVMD
jgi:DHA2 family multidrug resistance protein